MTRSAMATRLLSWATENGAVIHPSMELTETAEAGRSWKASEAIELGTTLLRVPRALCIASPTISALPSAATSTATARTKVIGADSYQDEAIAKVAAHLAAVEPPLPPACSLAVLVAFLLCDHERKVGRKRNAVSAQSKSQDSAGERISAQSKSWSLVSFLSWLFGDEDDGDEGHPSDQSKRLDDTDLRHKADGCVEIEGFEPYFDCMPPLEDLRLLPCWPDTALAGLRSTTLRPRIETLLEQRRRSRAQMVETDCGDAHNDSLQRLDWLVLDLAEDVSGATFGSGDEGKEALAVFLTSALQSTRQTCYADQVATVTAEEAGQHLAYAALLGKSRSFTVPIAGHGYCRLLVPLIDFVNHMPSHEHSDRSKSQCTIGRLSSTAVRLSADDGAAILVSTRRIEAGEEVGYDYGGANCGGSGLSSADCLSRFGFVEDTSTYNRAERAAVPLAAIQAAIAATRSIKHGPEQSPGDEIVELPRLRPDNLADDITDICNDQLGELLHRIERELAATSVLAAEGCHNAHSQNLLQVAAAAIDWTMMHWYPRSLHAEQQWLGAAIHHAELDSMLPNDCAQHPLFSSKEERCSEVDMAVSTDADWHATGGRVGSWCAVQGSRLRLAELKVLDEWSTFLQKSGQVRDDKVIG